MNRFKGFWIAGLIAVAGCGGSSQPLPFPTPSPTAPAPSPTPTPRTRARLSIAWGQRSRATGALSSALSCRVTLLGTTDTGGDLSFVIDRAAEPAAYTGTYDAPETVPVGARTVVATFYAERGAAGTVVGEARGGVTLDASGVVPTIATTGAITRVQIPAGQRVRRGTTVELTFSASGADGTAIAVTPGSAVYNVLSGAAFLTVSGTTATGQADGSATVTATVDGITSDPAIVEVTGDDTGGATATGTFPGSGGATTTGTFGDSGGAAVTVD